MQYKVILSNRSLYREVILPVSANAVIVGTASTCEVRLSKNSFFEHFEIRFQNEGEHWTVECSANVYLSAGTMSKLPQKRLVHGDELQLRYFSTDAELLNMSIMIDFDEVNQDFERVIDISKSQKIMVGGGVQCEIGIKDANVSGDLVSLERKQEGYYLTELKSKYGVYVNGVRIRKGILLHEYDFFSLDKYKFFLKGNRLYTTSETSIQIRGLSERLEKDSASHLEYPKFNRNSRVQTKVCEDKITVLNPPEKPQKPQENLLATIMPTIFMLVLTVVMRGLMSSNGGMYVLFSACTMGVGIGTTIVTYFSGKKKYRKETEERESKYNAYIQSKREELEQARTQERNELNEIYMTPKLEESYVKQFHGSLFDRLPLDADFLELRVGTGSRNSARPVEFKKQEAIEVTDELMLLPERLHREYQHLENAPITLPLASYDAVGVVGTEAECYEMLKVMTYDLCIRQYHAEVKLYYIMDEQHAKKLAWTRWLPHVENAELGVRNIVCDSVSRNLLFEQLFVKMSAEAKKDTLPAVQHVIFVMDDMGIKNHPVSQYIENGGKKGFTFIFFERYEELLPQHCNAILRMKGDAKAELVNVEDGNHAQDFCYEKLSDAQMEEAALKLAPIYCDEVSLESSLTKSYSFFQMMDIFGAEDIDLGKNWAEARIGRTMAAPLGINAKKERVMLDLHEKAHGPHGLVAGTTGSGKSEILQSYILSMAVHYHPYEVGFVIIDFKGGGMANQFLALPHLIGTITNIDGKEIDRSLKSIKAELQKRQQLFAEHGVNKIDKYIQKFKQGEAKTALPHLIIIVDEFAELKAEQPEFMKELISAARIGRSLGVHLILATQKPSGQVNEQIWSNSKFKLCLKVQTQEDSKEVIKSPLAAEIREPGRAYLQVGNNELFELFQSAYSGGAAKADEGSNVHEFSIHELNLWGQRKVVFRQKKQEVTEDAKSKSQLDVIVDYIRQYCEKEGIERLPSICMPSLPAVIPYRAAKHEGNDILVDIGTYDAPEHQYQGAVTLNLSAQNTMIIGSSQYGKTNLLQTIVRAVEEEYTPEQVNLYILDFGSMIFKHFERSNFVGGVVCASDDEKLKNLFRMLNTIMAERKDRMAAVGVSSFASYREAGYTDLPQIILLADNYTALRELYLGDEDFLLPICRDGLAMGISVVLTNSQTNGIGYKYMSNFSQRIALYCNDSGEYSTLLERCRMVPANVPGRGIIEIDKTPYEFQTYLGFDGVKEIERVREIRQHVAGVQERFGELCARQIPEVPVKLDERYRREHLNMESWKPYVMPTGIDYETVDWMALDLTKVLSVAVTGREKFGRTNIVALMMNYLQENVFEYPSKAYIIDDYDRQLSGFASFGFVEKYTVDTAELDYILEEMENELKERTELLHNGGSLAQEPLLLCILQNESLMAAEGIKKNTAETIRRIQKNYGRMKVCFVFANVENVSVPFNGPEGMKLAKECKHIYVCDDLVNLKLTDIAAATARRYKKALELGDAYLITDKDVSKQKIIHAGKGG